MKQADFVGTYGPLAGDIAEQTGLHPNTVLGLIAQETGWGDHVGGNNPFGISPGGKVAAYPSVGDAGAAFVNLMKSPRYAAAAQQPDPASQAMTIARSGYNTGPGYGPSVGNIAAKLGGGAAPVASGSGGAPSGDDLLQRMNGMGGGAAPGGGGAAPSADDLLKRMDEVAPAAAGPAAGGDAAKPGEPASKTGMAANIGAGVLTGAAQPLNVLADPFGTLVGKPLATAAVAAHDALAPVFGYQRFPDDVRKNLLDDAPGGAGGGSSWSQPGTGLVNALGASDVTAATPAEARARTIAAGATGGLLLAPTAVSPVVGALAGAAGGLTGGEASKLVPEWAAPVTELAGNVVGAAAGVGGLAGARVAARTAADNPLSRFINRFGNGPEAVPPPAPPPPEPPPIPPGVDLGTPPAPFVPTAPGASSPNPLVPPGPGGSTVGAANNPTPIPTREAMIGRTAAEGMKLSEPQQPGVRDLNQYVAGSNPTVAEIEQTVEAARDLKASKNIDTAVSQEAREIAAANNDARQRHYWDTAGSPADVENLRVARDTAFQQSIDRVFSNAGQADATPVVALADRILASGAGKEGAVQTNVQAIRDLLHDRAGELETDPSQLYGVRREINNRLSKQAAIEKPTNQLASRQLIQLRDAIDQAIEPAAPGFRTTLSQYAEASRPIDAMELLQSKEAGLYDTQGRIQYSRVQRLMKEAVAARHHDAPLNPWQSVTDDQMGRLWALRDDMRRVATADDLARAQGSDTVPNAIDVAKRYAGIAASATPVLGPMIYRIKALTDPMRAAVQARRIRTEGMAALHPDPARYPLRNPLNPP